MSKLAEARSTDVLGTTYMQTCKTCVFVWTYTARRVEMRWPTQCTWMYPELDFFIGPRRARDRDEKTTGALKAQFNTENEMLK